MSTGRVLPKCCLIGRNRGELMGLADNDEGYAGYECDSVRLVD